MRIKSKVIQIAVNANIAQMESALDNWLNQGWEIKLVFVLGVNTYAVLTRTIAK